MGYNWRMEGNGVRQKYIDFFKGAPRNHIEIPPAPLIVEGDASTLFTSAGMQPLIPYLVGEEHPLGKRLTNSQPSIRTQDIDEVGDASHLTFFEMLGNWSLGDYFKEEQLAWIWDFFTRELLLPEERLWVTVFEGCEDVGRDDESYRIWKKLGVPEKRIKAYGVEKNWWSRSGIPSRMPMGEIGGPDSEVFFDFGLEKKRHENSQFRDSECHPNCDCGRFLEIGNSVFIQYKKIKDGLEELPKRNVDFGGGLERLTCAVSDNVDIFTIDLFAPIVEMVSEMAEKKYGERRKDDKLIRVVADHLKASVFLVSQGVVPGNKMHGYVLRRLIRRAMVKLRGLKIDAFENFGGGREIVESVFKIYQEHLAGADCGKVAAVLEGEVDKFKRSVVKGEQILKNHSYRIDGKVAFDLYQSWGFPFEIINELVEENGGEVDEEGFRAELEKHRELSKSASSGMFKGGLADHSEEVVRLHTVTHLIHAALRKILGEHVVQKGSNITHERLRFDFSHRVKLSDGELRRVEEMVNEMIGRKLTVISEVMDLKEARKVGAVANFTEKYGERVKVYSIGDLESGEWFSKEVCGGPHVTNLSEIGGRVKITKQESPSSEVRRVYAVLKK